jgi:hypothetical protein
MGEDARQRAAFRALEQLLEPEPRVLQDVLRTCRPLSGEEFEQVVAPLRRCRRVSKAVVVASVQMLEAGQVTFKCRHQVVEERALTGYCGNPMCMQQLGRVAGGKMRRKLYQSTYCR